MPLVKRAVEPVFISRTTLDKQVKNELEGVIVNSLAGVIKQLSSISKHAENLFADLFNEANVIFQRSTALNERVKNLFEKTALLDASAKEDGKRGLGWKQLHIKDSTIKFLSLNFVCMSLKQCFQPSCATSKWQK